MADVPTIAIADEVHMPMVGLGTAGLLGSNGYTAIRRGLDLGYRHVDTATAYDNEAEVGRALRDCGVDRADVFVTTKLPPERAADAAAVLEEGLRALDVDYIDLWLIHWLQRDMRLASVTVRLEWATKAPGLRLRGSFATDRRAQDPVAGSTGAALVDRGRAAFVRNGESASPGPAIGCHL